MLKSAKVVIESAPKEAEFLKNFEKREGAPRPSCKGRKEKEKVETELRVVANLFSE